LYVKAVTPTYKSGNPDLAPKDIKVLVKEAWDAFVDKDEWEEEHAELLETWKAENDVFMKKNPDWVKTPAKAKKSKDKKGESGSMKMDVVESDVNGGGDQVVV
jgi:hypothetical protein